MKGLKDLEEASSALASGSMRIWVETPNPHGKLTGHFIKDEEIYGLLKDFLTFNALLGNRRKKLSKAIAGCSSIASTLNLSKIWITLDLRFITRYYLVQ